jgi:hypothetical protein
MFKNRLRIILESSGTKELEKTAEGGASLFVVLIKYNYDCQWKEDEIGRSCRVPRREKNE